MCGDFRQTDGRHTGSIIIPISYQTVHDVANSEGIDAALRTLCPPALRLTC